MTDEYVLRSSVLKAIHNGDIDMGMVTTHEYRLLKDLSERIDRRIQRVPVSDVQPVRHGRWKTPNAETTLCTCSVCGKVAPYDVEADTIMYWPALNYCPNCGAKMDGGET